MLRLMTSATTAQSSRHYSLGDWIANYTLASQLPSECRGENRREQWAPAINAERKTARKGAALERQLLDMLLDGYADLVFMASCGDLAPIR